jgi:hypothetical protein
MKMYFPGNEKISQNIEYANTIGILLLLLVLKLHIHILFQSKILMNLIISPHSG